ncbi:MAG: hypothetical protein A2Y94_09915 [Caldithrix sp. RBG_13_44_9]|nr:MAG: hypothetical protein A2Y94_09915 [Caldithrix sp. RBG_13_44_9]
MARRIRRDLSNKTIRKLVDKKFKESRKPTEHPPATTFSFRIAFKRIIYLVIFASLIFLVYRVASTPAFLNLFKDQKPTISRRSNGQERSTPAASAKQPEKSPEPQPVLKPVKQKMQVEVLNGCGTAGIAAVATDFLRKSDVDVIYSGNFNRFDINQSMVLDRLGDKDNAEEIADILGIETEQVKTEINPNRQLDVTVILGKDYPNLKPFKK